MIHPALLLLLCAGFLSAASQYVPLADVPPLPAREFRGAWVATVNNIDWPSKPGLPTAQQKQELLAILNRCQQLKLNVVIFQVRPACDALYKSKIEPWSEYLTGQQGKAPEPSWDPLEFVIAEAHARGMELHAWFNPFRARHLTAFSPLSKDHISQTKPAWVKTYGKHLWLDPALPEVHDYSARVILDVVKRYDIDGVHIDDYFYPYREKDAAGKEIPFPDWASWANYQRAGGKLSRDDWRRDNVNRFVARMYRDVKATKPWVQVGISPFGIYRPGNPPQIKGFDQYESIFADPKQWLVSGNLDYIVPQLYWRIDPPAQSFPVLLNWWTENNPKQKLIVAGMNSAAVGTGTNGWTAGEIVRQVNITRTQAGSSGHVYWNMSSLNKNKGGLVEALSREVYQRPALVPAASRTPAPPAPRLVARPTNSGTRFQFDPADANARFVVLQTRAASGNWETSIRPAHSQTWTFSPAPLAISVRTIDRFNQASPATALVAIPSTPQTKKQAR